MLKGTLCEPELCEPELCELLLLWTYLFQFTHKCGSQVIWIFLWFKFFHSSQISREPVNRRSQITPEPNKQNNKKSNTQVKNISFTRLFLNNLKILFGHNYFAQKKLFSIIYQVIAFSEFYGFLIYSIFDKNSKRKFWSFITIRRSYS